MSTNFKKLALAVGVAAGLASASMPTQAIMHGAAGEALLVPLVVYGGAGTTLDPYVNTVIRVTIPSTLGHDTLPNSFTAPNTTPTNPTYAMFPPDADLWYPGHTSTPSSAIHWFWFDYRSVHRLSRGVPVTVDDVVEINWKDVAGPTWENEPGYMVIGTEMARTGAAANFAMYGDAWLLFDDPTTPRTFTAYEPVLPMSDGADGADPLPSVVDQVKYTAGGVPSAVSPLVSGMRTNRSDGDLADFTLFDVALSDRTFPTIQVVWLDTNLGNLSNFWSYPVNVDVYDTYERTCNTTVELPNELNVIWVPPLAGSNSPWWTTQYEPLCLPTGASSIDNGFVRYVLPEYLDPTPVVDAPRSAGVAFSLTYEPVVPTAIGPHPSTLEAAINIAHERGTYKF